MTTYQAGTRSFDNLEDEIEFATRCDFAFIAIFFNGQFVSEHEVV